MNRNGLISMYNATSGSSEADEIENYETWLEYKVIDSIARIETLEKLINSPELDDFIKGVQIESAHQTERWGQEQEDKNYPHHYALVLDKLKGKQAIAIWDLNVDKYKHHLITMSAVCYNVFRQMHKESTTINTYFEAEVKKPTK